MIKSSHMQERYACKFCGGGIDFDGIKTLRKVLQNDSDIYQFGVFTGNGLKRLLQNLPEQTSGHFWGFDSFEGIPSESKEEQESWRLKNGKYMIHFLEGGYSAASVFKTNTIKDTISKVERRIGFRDRLTLIPGFYGEVLNKDIIQKYNFKKAGYIDMDADIYQSTIDSLSWMFQNDLITPGTIIRYDDWPRRNSTFGEFPKTNFYGQARAHHELMCIWDASWKVCGNGMIQITKVGKKYCGDICQIIPTTPHKLPLWFNRNCTSELLAGARDRAMMSSLMTLQQVS